MFKRFLQFVLLVALPVGAQTYTYPALSTSNLWTGLNSFGGPFLVPSVAPVTGGPNCLQISLSGVVTNTGSPCGLGTVGPGVLGQAAIYTGPGTVIAGGTLGLSGGGTGATSVTGAQYNLGVNGQSGSVIPGLVSGADNSTFIQSALTPGGAFYLPMQTQLPGGQIQYGTTLSITHPNTTMQGTGWPFAHTGSPAATLPVSVLEYTGTGDGIDVTANSTNGTIDGLFLKYFYLRASNSSTNTGIGLNLGGSLATNNAIGADVDLAISGFQTCAWFDGLSHHTRISLNCNSAGAIIPSGDYFINYTTYAGGSVHGYYAGSMANQGAGFLNLSVGKHFVELGDIVNVNTVVNVGTYVSAYIISENLEVITGQLFAVQPNGYLQLIYEGISQPNYWLGPLVTVDTYGTAVITALQPVSQTPPGFASATLQSSSGGGYASGNTYNFYLQANNPSAALGAGTTSYTTGLSAVTSYTPTTGSTNQVKLTFPAVAIGNAANYLIWATVSSAPSTYYLIATVTPSAGGTYISGGPGYDWGSSSTPAAGNLPLVAEIGTSTNTNVEVLGSCALSANGGAPGCGIELSNGQIRQPRAGVIYVTSMPAASLGTSEKTYCLVLATSTNTDSCQTGYTTTTAGVPSYSFGPNFLLGTASGMTNAQLAIAGSATTITSSIGYGTIVTPSTIVERDTSGNIEGATLLAQNTTPATNGSNHSTGVLNAQGTAYSTTSSSSQNWTMSWQGTVSNTAQTPVYNAVLAWSQNANLSGTAGTVDLHTWLNIRTPLTSASCTGTDSNGYIINSNCSFISGTTPTVNAGVCWKTTNTLGTCTAGTWPNCTTCN